MSTSGSNPTRRSPRCAARRAPPPPRAPRGARPPPPPPAGGGARGVPKLATSKWWKEERHGVFVDYNQNAKDRTVASAYSVRPTADARVSAPLSWGGVEGCDPRDFTLATVPARFAKIGGRRPRNDETPRA